MIHENVEADILRALLERLGWVMNGGNSGLFEIWSDPDRRAEVLVPLDPSKRDFSSLLKVATDGVFAADEYRAEREFRLLSAAMSDALDSAQWARETDVGKGTIPWNQGTTLYHAATASLAASAKAAVEHRRQFGAALAYVANSALDHVLMGQTAVSSYVVTAHIKRNTRIHVSEASQRHAQEGRPRKSQTIGGKEVLQALEAAVSSTREALNEYRKDGESDVFLAVAESGVSVEMTEALTKLTTDGESAVRVSVGNGTGAPREREIAFSPADVPGLTKATETLRKTFQVVDGPFAGEVIGLDNMSDNPIRLVRLQGLVDGVLRKVRVRLTPEEYARAVEAHGVGAHIGVRGRIEREGNRLWLYNPSDFTVLTQTGDPTPQPAAIDFEALKALPAIDAQVKEPRELERGKPGEPNPDGSGAL